MAVFQPDGGYLLPERCIISHVMMAQSEGARIHGCEPVLEWHPAGSGYQVKTTKETYLADRLVVAAGAWIGKLVEILQGIVEPERQVLAWLQPNLPELFAPECFPVFNVHVPEGRYYGLPVHGIPGFKIGRYHHLEEKSDIDRLDRSIHDRDEILLREFADRYFPAGAGPTMSLQVCAFTNTSDEHFILDEHPECPGIYLASPCSGHGFKFCSVIGEIIAEWVDTGRTRHDVSLHRLERFNQS